MKDIDLERRIVTVRDGKGNVDRVTVLPRNLVEPVRAQIEEVRRVHERDLAEGGGEAELPCAARPSDRTFQK